MRQGSRALCGALGVVFGGWLVFNTGVAVGQEPVPIPAPAPAPAEIYVPEPPPVPCPPAAPKQDDKKAEPKPFWTTVPPYLTPIRTGNLPIPPTGPGYYSLKDVCKDEYREKPPKLPWAPVSPMQNSLFDSDFRYLDDPKNTVHDCFDPLKRIHLGDCWLLSFSGEERNQFKNEVANGERLNGLNNPYYDLNRIRLAGDLWYLDRFRIYAEFIDAETSHQSLPPLAIDVNKGDFLNLFTDVKLGEVLDHPVYVRGGRQELLYGSQRLISPLDWANTRRTFEGVKTFWRGDKFDVDAFWVRPVNIFPSRLDSWDVSRNFAGLWTTYRPKEGQTIDAYYLYLDQDNPVATPVPPGGRGGLNVNTVGSRYAGRRNDFLWDFEGMYQFGTVQNNSISAGAATSGVGWVFSQAQLNPTFWLYYDYASGDDKGGRGGTFNQLFPFGHYYFGFVDAVGRQNINDLNLHMYLYPAKWITTGVQGHFFYLDSGRDALYNAAGTAIRKDPTGRSGLHVGDEIDFFTNFHLSMHQDILVGFSQLFAGEFIRNTGSPRSPELMYVQYSFRW